MRVVFMTAALPLSAATNGWMRAAERLEDANQHDARTHESHARETAGADGLRLEADPPEMIDEDGRNRLAGDDRCDQRCGSEPGSSDDRAGDVERAECTAHPDPPWSVTESAQRRQASRRKPTLGNRVSRRQPELSNSNQTTPPYGDIEFGNVPCRSGQ